MPPTSPPGRCALTAPFHPCLCPDRDRDHRRSVLCGTVPRFGRSQPTGWVLPTTVSCRVRTFLPSRTLSGPAAASSTHQNHYTTPGAGCIKQMRRRSTFCGDRPHRLACASVRADPGACRPRRTSLTTAANDAARPGRPTPAIYPAARLPRRLAGSVHRAGLPRRLAAPAYRVGLLRRSIRAVRQAIV